MKTLLLATAALALLSAGPTFAQSATSGSTSGAVSGSVSGAVNGPIDASSRNTSNSDSSASANTASLSVSRGGDAASTSTAVTGPSTATATTGASTATANPNANNAGNAQNITFNTTNPDSVRTVPQVYAPALTTTLTETCMGSTSGGASWLGGGFSLGSSWRDEECTRRLTARELSQTLGDREAARAVLCGNKAVLEAYDRLGRPCPQSPLYKTADAAQYMPQLPAPPAPPAPAPPVIVNVPAPAPLAAAAMMAPVPNPPPVYTPIHRRRHVEAPVCHPAAEACHK